MTYDQRIIGVLAQLASRCVCDGYVLELDAGFEREGWNDCDLLFGHELRERVLILLGESLYGI